MQDTNAPSTEERQGSLFMAGMRLVWSYIKLHPKPFIVSLAGAMAFAVSSILLTDALARATNTVLEPALTPPPGGGPAPGVSATGVTVTDTLPPEVTFVSAPGCSQSSGVVTCTLGGRCGLDTPFT